MMNVLIIADHSAAHLFCLQLESLDDILPIVCPASPAALAWCQQHDPDLVLLDYRIPDSHGLEFIRQFRAMPGKQNTPLIMMTALADSAIREQALQLGVSDFLSATIDPIELRARIRNLLAQRQQQLQLADQTIRLTAEFGKAASEMHAREREVIYRLSQAAEYRDPQTGSHILRMARYSFLVAKNLGLPESEQELILDAAPMHDVGKIGIPDHILLKPGRLEPSEMVIMRQHAEIGAKILQGSSAPLLQAAALIAHTHHEKLDGSGYPRGLKGTEIPLYGRIVAVADVFDALVSPRPYKPAWTLEQAIGWLRKNAGIHFDPQCVDAFFKGWEDVLAVHQQYQEQEATWAGPGRQLTG
jgi:response regulator RpfG family c-di-GMP phosphodiesterase